MTRKKTIILSVAGLCYAVAFLGWWAFAPIKSTDASFEQLPGWPQAELGASFAAFEKSCQAFLKQPSARSVGSSSFQLSVKDWLKPCMAAQELPDKTNATLHAFFEQWFRPVFFNQHKPVNGLFTGYYLPELRGSWQKTEQYRYPIYGVPKDLLSIKLSDFDKQYQNKKLVGRIEGNSFVPYHSRAKIDHGVLLDKEQPLLWVDDPIERFFLEIQGSGYVSMADGSRLMLGYAAQNGQPYTAVGRYLLEKGWLNKAQISMQGIRQYLVQHPQHLEEVLHQNASFIFFKILEQGQALGAQGVALTPGYSLAVDRRYIPLGTPIWLNTSYPAPNVKRAKPLQRLMIAQDTGGAIKGHVRGDVFWGGGELATYIAGHMKNPGRYWILLPK